MEEQNQVDPNAPVAQPEEKKQTAKEKAVESFSGVFFEKLKEQSFTILLMLAVVYYQHSLWQADKDALSKEVDAKEERILQLVEREHSHTLEREAALREKRDQFVEMLKADAAACRGTR
jgi:hypothetical protein